LSFLGGGILFSNLHIRSGRIKKNMPIITSLTSSLAALFALGIFIADVLIAIGVYRDATARKTAGKPVMILTPGTWSFICLIISLAGLALYWVIHYSTFAKFEDNDKNV